MEDAVLALQYGLADGMELYNLDYKNRGELPRFNDYLSTLRNFLGLRVEYCTTPSQLVLVMGVNASLSNQFIRLAISHAIPRDIIMSQVDTLHAIPNEIVGIPFISLDYPNETEWESIRFTGEVETNMTLNGHITYDIEKAWNLMELANYNMQPFREFYTEKQQGTSEDSSISFITIVFVLGILGSFRNISRLRRRLD